MVGACIFHYILSNNVTKLTVSYGLYSFQVAYNVDIGSLENDVNPYAVIMETIFEGFGESFRNPVAAVTECKMGNHESSICCGHFSKRT